jgi:hypothetical protein
MDKHVRAGLGWLGMVAWMSMLGILAGCQGTAPPEPAPIPIAPVAAAPAPASPPESQTPNPDPWPRTIAVASGEITLYQPQVESWQGNQLHFRCAVASTATGSKDKIFGVVWGTALTAVDRVSRRVTLDDFVLTRSRFPTLADQGAALRQELAGPLQSTVQTIALDRLEASLAAAHAPAAQGRPVRNTPPRIFVSDRPAILIPIAGQPVWRPVPATRFERVLNTRAALLRDGQSTPDYYLHVYDGWLSAKTLQGPWRRANQVPDGLDQAVQALAKQGRVDLLDGGRTKPAPTLAKGVPEIFVSEEPAELIVFEGEPNFVPIEGLSLLWASNTTSDVIVNMNDESQYVLLAGRWYSAPSLKGPWKYVSSESLPLAFKDIPPGSPAGVVLPAVAGTTQAQEALIANSIPQTARVSRVKGPEFSVEYDGEPKTKAIAETSLQYVVNADAPVIRVDEDSWYGVQAGVWFVSSSANGPWAVATEVPDVIYTIPPSASLHYVTYVHVYDSTDEWVDVGYTPGYLGTVVAPDGVVVYGTGYSYTPWIGEVYYAAPATWDVMAQPVYNPAVGWTYGFGLGLTTAAIVDTWGAPIYYTSDYHGYACCGTASANVYGHWGNTVTSGTRTAYSYANGTVGERASGSYTNERTGTTGSYSAYRSVNPYTGQAQRGSSRSFDTARGTTGDVSHDSTYDADTGERTRDSSFSAQGQGGSTIDHSSSASVGPDGVSADRSTTVDNARTGQSHTFDSGLGSGANDHYASADGSVFRSDGNGGWQSQAAGGGWQNARGNTGWADQEQQARSQGQARLNGMQSGGWGGGAGGFGGGGGLARGGGGFGGGGWAGQAGGGFGGRFGGGGFGGGGRFGGGGFGGGGRMGGGRR